MKAGIILKYFSKFLRLLILFCLAFAAIYGISRCISGLLRPADTGRTSAADTTAAVPETTAPENTASSLSSEETTAADTDGPVISGAGNKTVLIGTPVLYKTGVTAVDEVDGPVKLEVNTSAVNPLVPGSYEVIYSASDKAGNEAVTVAIFTFVEALPTAEETQPTSVFEPDNHELAAETRRIYDSIITADMTDRQKVTEIYRWTRSNIRFVDMIHEGDWEDAALYAFQLRKGSCYMFFAAAKALIRMAGIPQIDVEKMPLPGRAMHYWNLVYIDDSWYHVDSTPRAYGGEYLFLTDEQMLECSEQHNDCFDFDLRIYPRTPGTIDDRFLIRFYPDWFDENGNRIVDANGHKKGTPEYDPGTDPSSFEAADLSSSDVTAA